MTTYDAWLTLPDELPECPKCDAAALVRYDTHMECRECGYVFDPSWGLDREETA